ncbi:hypothetical protein AMJ39_06935 [candidate division TA06 bacterium DG_24]|jgi:hypothetical protein|uniref:Uncharacterized protein n=3 Tax=Bacteria division TA06 TaxID=1156500 RepID=A0A0S8JAD6_UNCT6|nr:MAG: hypothetical protein AMJ39_06935 [candidate division TA06 bacterium DG_24]KPK68521.1 MAG: hypothetical protein AMJ82_08045 [candidate division TA06 bacterium SM23_40]KPL06721.1 MAG: hypothetical protein AMJ71_09490 [candidate division TA06 bacterium SM1_40]
MRGFRWQIVLGLSLVLLSAVLYILHYTMFHDAHHIFIYMVGDVAFVPVEVLLVTLIIHRLLSERERRARLEKLNMVIGTFFSEVGTRALAYFSDFDPNLDRIKNDLVVQSDWPEREFADVRRRLGKYDYGVEIRQVNLQDLRTFLIDRRDFLLRLLENPNLLEHEAFTDLLRAVFHLTEELAHRDDLGALPDTDHAHIAGDIKRAYVLLVRQWLDYMKYLRDNYPYLFSLAMRTNPFDQTASAIVT